MANLQKIRELCKKENLSLKEFSKVLSITEAGLQYILNNNSTSLENLEKIAHYFNVPVSYFFDETEPQQGINQVVNGNNNKLTVSLNECRHKVELLQKENEGLKKEIAAKDKIIKLLEGK